MKCTVKPSWAMRHVTMELVYACFINNKNNCRSTVPCSTCSSQSSQEPLMIVIQKAPKTFDITCILIPLVDREYFMAYSRFKAS
jgi:hypothetical protein